MARSSLGGDIGLFLAIVRLLLPIIGKAAPDPNSRGRATPGPANPQLTG